MIYVISLWVCDTYIFYIQLQFDNNFSRAMILINLLKFIYQGVEPKIARWDYHATHVNQLLLLATIDRDPIIMNTAERWRRYMTGKRAQHN